MLSSFGSVTNSVFTHLVAKVGPAITARANKVQQHDSSLSVINSTFTNNTALLGGGALYVEEVDILNIVSSQFVRNTALSSSGGAVYLSCFLDD